MRKSLGKFILIFVITLIIGGVIAGGVILTAVMGMWGNTEGIDISVLTMDKNSDIVYLDPDTGEEKILLTLNSGENRIWVDLDATPKNLQNAFIAIEDERFRTHKGVDIKRTAKATVTYFIDKLTGKGGQASLGGSTITQQLIKNITGDADQTIARKISEISKAIDLEKQMSKDQILELYMNCIFLAENCHGVQTAANLYFDKDVSQLNLAECASIASITQNPSLYDPFINPDKNKERQELVLAKMLSLGFITQEEYDEAVNYPIKFSKETASAKKEEITTSYYVDQVVRDAISKLQEKGYSETLATKMVYSGGLKIYCAYEPEIQAIVENYYYNENNFPDSEAQSSIVIMDPSDGRVMAMAGGIGEKTSSFSLNRAVQSPRQPGSTIKPIAVYAPALDNGTIDTSTRVMDQKKSYDGWVPRNYSYKYSNSKVGLDYAIQQSLNTIPVEIMSEMGIRTSYDFMTQKLGFTTLVEAEEINGEIYTDLGYAQLALGGLTHGATNLEMTAAYCIFPNKGIYNKPYTFTEIKDESGETILYGRDSESSWEAIKPETAAIMNRYLNSVVTSGTGRGAALSDGTFTAGKTGTTSENFDRWFIGYTPYYVAAVWYGYDTPKSIQISSNPCIPVWKSIMDKVHSTMKSKSKSIDIDYSVSVSSNASKTSSSSRTNSASSNSSSNSGNSAQTNSSNNSDDDDDEDYSSRNNTNNNDTNDDEDELTD
ncbi:MAG: PBP1A family penicillin-binding protein [Clostridiales bacterium]|nr:PBP1A family penicillin-binding protein [Clostridiales bacterium]